MSNINSYVGNVHEILFDIFQKKDGFTVGEKFTAVEKLLKNKKYYNSTDKEIYEAMERYKNTPVEVDEVMTEEEFIGWVNIKTADGRDVTIFAANAALKK